MGEKGGYNGRKTGGNGMDFEKLAAYRNAHNPFARKLGIHLEEIRQGYARAVKTVEPEEANPVGVTHGGVYFTLADVVCGAASSSKGYMTVTVNALYNFLRSAKVVDRLIAEGREIKHGRTVNVYEARITDQDGALLGTGTFTFYQLDQKIPL